MTAEMKRNMSKTKGHSKVIHLVVALALVLSFSLVTTVPALAAPVVASVTETAFGTYTTDHYVDMPATVNAGDLLIALFTNDGGATVTTPSGWTQLASTANGSAVRLSVYYKIAAGTEGGTTVNFVTSANEEEAAAQVYRITNWHGTTPPEISTAATGTSTRPDPASLDPAGWDVADTLWLAVAGQDRGDQGPTIAYPAYYTDGISTLSSATTDSCRTLSARRVLAAASENPGAFTIPASEEWVAFTIAVRPEPRDLTTSSTEGGSVTEPGEDTFTYDDGTVVDLVADADEGYRFVEWTGDVEEIVDIYAAETTITMNGDYSITANFVVIYDLTTSSTAGGSVTTPGEGVFTYDDGTVVDLVAEAEEGYRFVEWTGDVGTIADVYAATTTITMNGNYSIMANFVAIYDLTVSSTAGGSVTTPGEGVFTYDEGTVVDLVAAAEEGYRFVEWTGNVGTIADVYAATTTITMNGDYSITANFVAIYDLTTSSTEGGSVTEPGEGVFTYDDGTVVDLVADADEGHRFVEWTGDVVNIADVYAATTTITMNGDYSITANFEEIPPTPVYPTVTTKAATNITTNSTTLNMNYTVGDFSPVQVRFAYKKSTDSVWSYTDWVPKSGDGTHAESLTGLDSSTKYQFKAQLKYDDTVIEGITLQFTTDTPSTPPPFGGCFIATAAYGTPTAEQIDVLREFRDSVLLESTAGSQFVALYYQLSPPVADFISGSSFLRTLVRELLVDPIVWVVEATGDIWRN
ncbi:MAG TPA: CFI-box-CTERM domain-containing protein [Dehalococcoidia bacterium]|nr:CFI-box-CTERM domain-containing protein [Dehalococcoidia bacterium]